MSARIAAAMRIAGAMVVAVAVASHSDPLCAADLQVPYFGQSPPSGALRITLPNGRYRLRVWHENLASLFQTQTVDVTDGMAPLTLSLEVSASHSTLAERPMN